MKKYRIGDFAKYLGVTPDFLKYYEQFDLVQPSYENNNYRYYPFTDSSNVLECLRLRNLGFPIKEIETLLLKSQPDEAQVKLNNKIEEIKANVEFELAVIEETKKFNDWLNDNKDNTSPYSLQIVEEKVYLTHASFQDFKEDEAVHDAVKSWVKWMPIVKSCRHVQFSNDEVETLNWGFIVSKEFLDKHHLLLNEACHIIKRQKMFVYELYNEPIESSLKLYQPALEKAKELNLNLSGELYEEVHMFTNMIEDRHKYCTLYFPIVE